MRTRREELAVKILTACYLFFVCAVLPAYRPDGYEGLGESKFLIYRAFSIPFAFLFLFFLIRFRERGREKRIFPAPFPAALLTVAVTRGITFLLSVDKSEALWGTEGWRIGFLTELLFFFFAYVFYRFCPEEKPVWYLALCGPFLVALYAVIERLMTAPYQGSAAFLSTVGNINWFGGFLSVFLPLSMVLFLMARGRKEVAVTCAVTFFFFFMVQILGSNAIWFGVAAAFLFLLFFALRDPAYRERFFVTVFLFAASSELLSLIRMWTNRLHPYDGTDLIAQLIAAHAGGILMGLSACVILFLQKKRREGTVTASAAAKSAVLKMLPAAVPLCLLVILLLQFLVMLPPEWGNSRGLIWQIGTDVFRSASPIRKIAGAGNDCFYVYAASFPQIAERMTQAFGESRLTNAHAELLTMLVNTGVMGVLSFLLLLGSFFYEALGNLKRSQGEEGKEDAKRRILISLLVTVSYLAYHTVSFEQILSTPYLYLFLGLGASGGVMRKESADK